MTIYTIDFRHEDDRIELGLFFGEECQFITRLSLSAAEAARSTLDESIKQLRATRSSVSRHTVETSPSDQGQDDQRS